MPSLEEENRRLRRENARLHEEREMVKKTFLARKGDVFIWHSDLVHGGSEILDPTKGRKSLVCHYSTEQDCRRIPELVNLQQTT